MASAYDLPGVKKEKSLPFLDNQSRALVRQGAVRPGTNEREFRSSGRSSRGGGSSSPSTSAPTTFPEVLTHPETPLPFLKKPSAPTTTTNKILPEYIVQNPTAVYYRGNVYTSTGSVYGASAPTFLPEGYQQGELIKKTTTYNLKDIGTDKTTTGSFTEYNIVPKDKEGGYTTYRPSRDISRARTPKEESMENVKFISSPQEYTFGEKIKSRLTSLIPFKTRVKELLGLDYSQDYLNEFNYWGEKAYGALILPSESLRYIRNVNKPMSQELPYLFRIKKPEIFPSEKLGSAIVKGAEIEYNILNKGYDKIIFGETFLTGYKGLPKEITITKTIRDEAILPYQTRGTSLSQGKGYFIQPQVTKNLAEQGISATYKIPSGAQYISKGIAGGATIAPLIMVDIALTKGKLIERIIYGKDVYDILKSQDIKEVEKPTITLAKDILLFKSTKIFEGISFVTGKKIIPSTRELITPEISAKGLVIPREITSESATFDVIGLGRTAGYGRQTEISEISTWKQIVNEVTGKGLFKPKQTYLGDPFLDKEGYKKVLKELSGSEVFSGDKKIGKLSSEGARDILRQTRPQPLDYIMKGELKAKISPEGDITTTFKGGEIFYPLEGEVLGVRYRKPKIQRIEIPETEIKEVKNIIEVEGIDFFKSQPDIKYLNTGEQSFMSLLGKSELQGEGVLNIPIDKIKNIFSNKYDIDLFYSKPVKLYKVGVISSEFVPKITTEKGIRKYMFETIESKGMIDVGVIQKGEAIGVSSISSSNVLSETSKAIDKLTQERIIKALEQRATASLGNLKIPKTRIVPRKPIADITESSLLVGDKTSTLSQSLYGYGYGINYGGGYKERLGTETDLGITNIVKLRGTIEKDIGREFTNEDVKFKTGQGNLDRNLFAFANLDRGLQRDLTRVDTASKEQSRQSFKFAQAAAQSQSEKQIEKLINLGRTPTRVPRNRVPLRPIPIIPKIPDFNIRKSSFDRKRKVNPAYTLLVKSGGRFVQRAKGLTRGRASALGENLVSRELSRQFKLVQSGTTTDIDIGYKPSENIFRAYKVRRGKRVYEPNTFIQRTSANLQSVSERQLLRASRIS